MLWILIIIPKCTETKWEVGTDAWSRRCCINLLRQWCTKSGANTCAVWSREESVAGSCVAGLIPGGRVPEERSRRGGAAVCRSVTALPARRALAAVSSCAAPRRAAIVPSSRQLLCLSATLVRMARLVWTCDVIFLFFRLVHLSFSGLWPFMCKIVESDLLLRILVTEDFYGIAAEDTSAVKISGCCLKSMNYYKT